MFSYVSLEHRVPAKQHPLRRVRALFDQALSQLSDEFDALYADSGRPSIPPEQLLRALLLQALEEAEIAWAAGRDVVAAE